VRLAKTDDHLWVQSRGNPAHRWRGGERVDVPLFVSTGAVFPSIRDRLGFYGLRLASIFTSAVTILAIGAAVRVVLGASAGAIAALLVATLPQFAAVSAAVTADDVTILLAALFAWQLLFLAALAAAGLLEVARRARLDAERLWWMLLVALVAVDVATIVTVRGFFAGA
jgi:hypothetical protein